MSPKMSPLVSGLPNTALVVIDVQQAFNLDPNYLTLERSTPKLESNIASLLAAFRAKNLPIIHIHHVNTKNEKSFWYEATRPEGVLPMDYVAPQGDEPVLRKYDKSSGFGACLVADGTTLSELLNARGIRTVILVGISSPHCVSSTARSAGDRGFSVVVVGDATATYAASVVDFGGCKGDSEGGNSWGAETVHGVAMAHLHGELANVVTTAEVLKYL
ncbi:Cysteine hydrolase [Mycena sanguinolenta]|uniref:Cysteine hydrolase n=1 Tax=Mycena sanguinolenta TaxID=230812 RepID=A0A8H6Z5F9_9AGAR|nr:Cysteine hydrolase [Mycena sanguinolenta]